MKLGKQRAQFSDLYHFSFKIESLHRFVEFARFTYSCVGFHVFCVSSLFKVNEWTAGGGTTYRKK